MAYEKFRTDAITGVLDEDAMDEIKAREKSDKRKLRRAVREL